MTIGNAKAVDLFAEKNDVLVQIQVKSIYWRKNSGWPMMLDKVKKDCMYIFVNLNANPSNTQALMNQPDFFICTGEETSKKINQYKTRGIMTVGNLNSDEYKNRWDKLQMKAKPVK
jgi:hypothetical protein